MAAEAIRIEIPIQVEDKSEPAMSNITSKFDRLKRAATDAGNTTQKQSRFVSQFDKSVGKTEKTLSGWVKQKYSFVLDAKDKVGPILSGIGSNLKSFAGKAWSTTLRVADLATKPIQGIINLLRNPILQVGAVLGISMNISDTINTYKDFEASMSKVSAISGATGAELDKLTAKAKELGESTKYTAAEVAQGFNYMGMAGWNSEQMTAGIGAVLDLAAASGEDLGTTSDIVTDALTAFNMKAEDATHFADVLAVASSNANTNVGMMGETFKYVGAASGSLGYSIEDVALGIGLMANAGIKSSQAGTELNAIFTRLATNMSGSRDAIEELGIAFYDQNGNARDFGKVLGELREKTKGMNNEQKVNLANTIAGQRAQAGLLAMLNATEADYGKVTEAIKNADGASHNMAETMQDNLQGSIIKLQSAWDGLKIKMGERMAPYIRSFAEWLTSQAPKIADVIENVMDKVDRLASNMKKRWSEMTSSMEWQDSGLLGKLKIAWDKMIMEPLSDWWNGTGKAQVAHFAGEFGNFLGSTLNAGISFLFGFDAGGVIDEGASVGKSFAKGFAEGFDFKAVASKVMSGIGNMFKSALKLIPGGQSAGLSSVISAALIAKGIATVAPMGINLARAGVGVGRLFKTVFSKGSAAGAAGEAASGSGGIGTMAAGGLGLGSKLLGLGTKAYGAFTGGAGTLTGVGASAAGLAGIGGAVTGGLTVVSGGMDVYRAIKADDEKAKAAYGKSAGWKLGGVAAGAAVGTAIFPGLGTAIGAGIGGIAGWIMGNREKKKYEEEMKRLEERRNKLAEVYKVAGVELDRMTFKSKELNEALEDSETTAEEFGYMFQTEVATRAKKAFGDVKLSLNEVKSLADKIILGSKQLSYDKFDTAIADRSDAYAGYLNSHYTMEEQTWRVSLGMELSDEDIDTFKTSVDSFVEEAKNYVEKSHYESTVAAKILMGENYDMTYIDSFYTGMQKEIQDKAKELNKQIEISLEGDFKIDTDEAKVITDLQNEISEITNKLASAQNEAEIEAIKLTYKASDLDSESFSMLQEQLLATKEQADELARQTFVDTTVPLKLALDNPELDESERAKIQEQLDLASENYKMQIKLNDMNFATDQIDALASAWQTELDTALSGLEGTTQEKITQVLNAALAVKPDVETWTGNDMMSWLGLDKINDTEAATNIMESFKSLASGVSESAKEELHGVFSETISDLMPTGEDMQKMFTTEGQIAGVGDIFSGFFEGLADNEAITSAISESKAGIQTAFEEGMSQLEFDKIMTEALNGKLSEGGLNEAMGTFTEAMAQGLDVSQFIAPLTSKFQELGAEIPNQLTAAITAAASACSFAEAASPIGTNFADAAGNAILASDNSPISSATSAKMNEYQSIMQASTSAGVNTSMPVRVALNWSLINPTHTFNVSGGGSGSVTVSAHAAGGYVSGGPQLSWLAEEGWGEYIIPTNPGRRKDALRLYEDAGKALGIHENAAGGYVSGIRDGEPSSDTDEETPYSPAVDDTSSSNVVVNVNMSPDFNISGAQNTEEIMAAIRGQIGRLTNDMSVELAKQLGEVFSNMPRRKGA